MQIDASRKQNVNATGSSEVDINTQLNTSPAIPYAELDQDVEGGCDLSPHMSITKDTKIEHAITPSPTRKHATRKSTKKNCSKTSLFRALLHTIHKET